jgi:ABC-2 type transport system permease protein
MNKVWLIFQREYLTKVKKKAFILTTLLVPILFVAATVGIGLISNSSTTKLRLAVKDDSGLFANKIRGLDTDNLNFVYYGTDNISKDSLLNTYEKLGFNGVLFIPEIDLEKNYYPAINYHSNQTIGFKTKTLIETELSEVIKVAMIQKLAYNPEDIARLDQKIKIQSVNINNEEASDITEIATAIGYLMAFIIYIYLFAYGSMVMRSVMEEKSNRIVEVIITTIKPFQLMMGKILGIGAVGLTQLLIWLVIFIGTTFAITAIIGPETMSASQGSMAGGEMAQYSPEDAEEMVAMIMLQLQEVNWIRVIFSFLFYFFFGYILYAAQFAAIGSAASDDGDVQTLMFPISIPIIISIVIMVSTIEDPYSGMARWGSMIPLTAPVVMMSRIPFFENAYWLHQLISMVLLMITSVGMVWIAGRIYRIGILIQGQKVTFGKLWKWLRY